MKRKLALIPTLFTISAFIVLVGLGTWQMQRLQWKNQRVEEVNQKSSMLAIDLPEKVENFEELEYRKVKVVGEFLHDKEIHLFTGPRVHRGKPGYDIITPLKRTDGSIVLVNRGWVPAKMKKRSERPDSLLQGIVEVEGMLHKGEEQRRFTPDNNIKENLWFWIDVSAIASEIGSDLQNLYVRRLKDPGLSIPEVPVAGEAVIKHRNDHLQYAITWYGLAITLLVIYVLYQLGLWKKEDEATGK